jgi:hypothetical protein
MPIFGKPRSPSSSPTRSKISKDLFKASSNIFSSAKNVGKATATMAKQTASKIASSTSSASKSAANTTASLATSAVKNVFSSVKQGLSDVDEKKYVEPRTKLHGEYDLNSNVNTSTFEVSSVETAGKDNKCLIYITCSNAKLVKASLQNHICSVNKTHENQMNSLKELSQFLELKPELPQNFPVLNTVLQNSVQQIASDRKTKRSSNIDLRNNKIEVSLYLKGFGDMQKGYIVELNPALNTLTIEYVTSDGKSSTLKSVKFEQLCIGDDINVLKPAQTCNLKVEGEKCNLDGGKKKSKKSKKMTGGGQDMVSSMSTDILC